MKKLLSLLLMLSFVGAGEVFAFSPTYSNPTESTINFYPMMRRQMEQDVTLDFETNREQYKKKRAKKDARAEYSAGNKNFNPDYGMNKGLIKFKKKSNKNMEFSTDSQGNILIKDTEE